MWRLAPRSNLAVLVMLGAAACSGPPAPAPDASIDSAVTDASRGDGPSDAAIDAAPDAATRCTGDDQCPSSVCERTGSCLAEDAVWHVSASGRDGAGCGIRKQPCRTLGAAVAQVHTGRITLEVAPGSYPETAIPAGVTVHIVAVGATLRPGPGVPALVIGPGANVELRGATLSGATVEGLRCGDTTGRTGLRLDDVVIADNAGAGLTATGCTLLLDRTQILRSGGLGIAAQACALRLDHSRLAHNLGGGALLAQAYGELVNDEIVHNGSPSSAVGGVGLPSFSTDLTFSFNTVADNLASSDALAGVACGPLSGNLHFDSNIVWGGGGGTGGCPFATSDLGGTPGGGNFSADPRFVAPDDYRLQAGSPCLDVAPAVRAPSDDFAGLPRPAGPGYDVGAHERP